MCNDAPDFEKDVIRSRISLEEIEETEMVPLEKNLFSMMKYEGYIKALPGAQFLFKDIQSILQKLKEDEKEDIMQTLEEVIFNAEYGLVMHYKKKGKILIFLKLIPVHSLSLFLNRVFLHSHVRSPQVTSIHWLSP